MTKKEKQINKGARSITEMDPFLFELPAPKGPEPLVKPIRNPIWTENKAKLIERYLYYFVLITRHGCYIDGFAGPQEPDHLKTWAAKLVLESRPKWLRHFHFFEADRSKLVLLEELKKNHRDREIEIHPGDFNQGVLRLLRSGTIGQNEATFCLLDQVTFECHWQSVEALASYKTSGNKIELFYFLANAWLDRALAAQRNEAVLNSWWGGGDWSSLRDVSSNRRVQLVVQRFKERLRYRSVKPWPIYERKGGGHIMYYMIHATDHYEAPSLMSRAYEKAVTPREPLTQLCLELGLSGQARQID
jgi:three-Cys-motif partner protein